MNVQTPLSKLDSAFYSLNIQVASSLKSLVYFIRLYVLEDTYYNSSSFLYSTTFLNGLSSP
jgi:hypothetical protein